MGMFCFQCQEACKDTGCVIRGVCGKDAQVANLQDLLIYLLKGIALCNLKAKKAGIKDERVDQFITESLFSTITNVNFDQEYFQNRIKAGLKIRDTIKTRLLEENLVRKENLHDTILWTAETLEEFEEKAKTVGVLATEDEDIRSLRELLIYGLKGMAAYAEHARILGYSNDEIYTFIQETLVATLDDSLTPDELVNLAMETGRYGVEVMALLDTANTATYGDPEITEVKIGVRNNPAILISGHDLRDMEELLEQTVGTGVDIYTHGEMLPANYYPAFKKYRHLVGNYGGAWWKQEKEFESFNGPILMTTNCLVPPKDSYKDRVYTTGLVGFPGVKHLPDRRKGEAKDFSALIAHAKRCASPTELEKGKLVGGFAHHTLFNLAEQVIAAVKSKKIRRFFVMAGCDGRMKSRNYYTEFAEKLPEDTVILTAGCAKYRYNKLNLGDIDGIPRVLDAGQCNDSYSLALIALKLKEAFELDDVNELPIVYNIAWYEQKAVIVLLALLHLGIKNIHLGPTLPVFLSANVAKVLVEKFGLSGITTAEDDLRVFLP